MSGIAELLRTFRPHPRMRSCTERARGYWPYLLALLTGMVLIICILELSLFLPRSAGLVR
jgi:hypothetical protein